MTTHHRPHPKPSPRADASTIPAGWKRRKPMARRSKKKRDLYEREGGRREVVERLLRERPACEIRCIVEAAWREYIGDGYKYDEREDDLSAWLHWPVKGRTRDVHEILPRSAGGSILDETNLLVASRVAHRWTHEHPKLARELGLLRSRYGGTDSQTSGPEPQKAEKADD